MSVVVIRRSLYEQPMYAVLVFAVSRPVLPLLVAAGALSALALGYLGVVSSVFDLFAQFTAHWLVIAVIAVVASYARSYAYTILASGVAFACLMPVGLTNWYDARATTAPILAVQQLPAVAGVKSGRPDRPGQFKLLTYNTYKHNSDLAAISAEVRRHDADVVVLVEFGPSKAQLVQELAKLYPYFKTCEQKRDCAIGLFSRLPVRRFEVVGRHDDAGPPLISAELEVGESSVTVIGAHALSPDQGTHANYVELDHLAMRVRQLRGPIVLAGDLNTTIWANVFDHFRRTSGLNHMGHLIPTWPSRPLPLPQIGIDHIFASPDLELSEVAAGHAAGSDHLPVVATVRWH